MTFVNLTGRCIAATGIKKRCRGIIMIFLVVFLLPAFCSGAEEGLVGYWKFDEGEGLKVQDSSGNGNHGIIHGNPEWIKGKIGMALRFDGEEDCVDCGNDTSLNMPAREITISLWLRPEALDGWARRVISKKVDWIEFEGYELTLRASTCRVEIAGSGPTYVSGIKRGLNDGGWHHVACTVTDTGTSIEAVVYVDGEKAGGGRTSAPIKSGENNLCIGSICGGRGSFKGGIDEVRIYNRALSGTEIKALYERR